MDRNVREPQSLACGVSPTGLLEAFSRARPRVWRMPPSSSSDEAPSPSATWRAPPH
jgi:hypothetical protein